MVNGNKQAKTDISSKFISLGPCVTNSIGILPQLGEIGTNRALYFKLWRLINIVALFCSFPHPRQVDISTILNGNNTRGRKQIQKKVLKLTGLGTDSPLSFHWPLKLSLSSFNVSEFDYRLWWFYQCVSDNLQIISIKREISIRSNMKWIGSKI